MAIADLNKMLKKVSSESTKLELDIRDFLNDYDNLYKEAHVEFTQERNEQGTIDGLEEFYHLVQLLRRNRDVIASMMRGMRNLKDINQFEFIEEKQKEKEEPKKTQKKHKPEPEVIPEQIQEVKIEEPTNA